MKSQAQNMAITALRRTHPEEWADLYTFYVKLLDASQEPEQDDT
jgi:hypothetical protein